MKSAEISASACPPFPRWRSLTSIDLHFTKHEEQMNFAVAFPCLPPSAPPGARLIYTICIFPNNPEIAKHILVSLPAPSPPLGEADRLAGTRSGTLVASGRQCGIVTSVGRLIDREG